MVKGSEVTCLQTRSSRSPEMDRQESSVKPQKGHGCHLHVNLDSLTSKGLNYYLKPLSIDLINKTLGLAQLGLIAVQLYVGCDRLEFLSPWDLANTCLCLSPLPSHKMFLSAAVCHPRSQELVSSLMGPRGSWDSDPVFSEAVTFPAEPVKLVSLNK